LASLKTNSVETNFSEAKKSFLNNLTDFFHFLGRSPTLLPNAICSDLDLALLKNIFI